MKLLVYSVVAVVVLAIISSFFIVGSPANERMRLFDERRTNDLSAIQSEVLNFWTQKEKLPLALGDLENNISYFKVPVDPQTGNSYEYKILGDYQFELCATFTTSNVGTAETSPAKPVNGYDTNWTHGSGRVCFTRAIDPELYRNKNLMAPPLSR